MDKRVREILSQLKRKGSKRNVEGLARYGIIARNVVGVSVADIRLLAKPYRKDTTLARALWETDVYEARMMVPFVADPAEITPAEMDRWTKDFDNWAICDAFRKGCQAAALELAKKLAASDVSAERWVGRDALRDLTR
jgi:3-methyladenine DNA glycosylase AlkD